jgi:hypothetical protein
MAVNFNPDHEEETDNGQEVSDTEEKDPGDDPEQTPDEAA